MRTSPDAAVWVRSSRPILVALLLAAFSVNLDPTIVSIALLVFTVIGARARTAGIGAHGGRLHRRRGGRGSYGRGRCWYTVRTRLDA